MKKYVIKKPDRAISDQLQYKIDNLTKPLHSLGRLEELAFQIGLVQQTLSPKLSHPCHIVFAADHGITAEKVSPSPQEVTRQMIVNFLQGGAGINFLARQHGFDLMVVDGGVNYDFPPDIPVINRKIRKSTRNYLHEAAMTEDEMQLALDYGAEMVQQCADKWCNIISFGEMGISNTSASSLWMSYFTGIPLAECIGAGCDPSGKIVSHKYNVLKQCMENYKGSHEVDKIMQQFGGYEMVMTVGGMIKAAQLGMIIIIDGFIMTSCLLAASKICPEILDYCIFGHCSEENGHKLLLDYLHAKPLLQLELCLGEGTGAICAYPIIDSAVRMINEMQSFSTFDVTKYF